MGKYQGYEKYKDSGVEWLGEIPEPWQLVKVRYYSQFVTSGSRGWSQYFADDGSVFLRIANVSRDGVKLKLEDIQRVIPPSDKEGERAEAISGDVIISITADLGSVATVPAIFEKAYVSQHLALVRPIHSKIYGQWIAYQVFADTGKNQLLSSGYGGTKIQLNLTDIKDLWILLPSQEEQESIIEFLDRKTSQIDTLIAKKEALLEKLDEKRTALISHAVTKGLDPSVPMKDSGVEWLGDIPEHWQPVKVRYYSQFVTSGSRGWSQYFADNGSVFLRIANVSRDGIELKLEDIQRVVPPLDKEGERAEAISGDVIISITADLGSVATVPDGFEKAYVSQHLALVRPIHSKIYSQWIAYQVFADIGKNQLLSSGYGGTKIQLNLTDIKDLWISLPSKEEQEIIIEFLKQKTAEIDRQKAKVKEAIELLKEYRTALITNAVTGKIDVRQVANV